MSIAVSDTRHLLVEMLLPIAIGDLVIAIGNWVDESVGLSSSSAANCLERSADFVRWVLRFDEELRLLSSDVTKYELFLG